ncbi:MAG TPA: hypothetical protein VJB67_03585 [Patescibacteria group bacterium]|nr:hypothetical protein [Patescibacteria group bacterium]
MTRQLKLRLCSADEIITVEERKAGASSKVLDYKRVVIPILASESMTKAELWEILKSRTDYNTGDGSELSERRAIIRLRSLFRRNMHIFGYQDGEWYVIGTSTDPNLIQQFQIADRPLVGHGSTVTLREIIFDILLGHHLTSGQVARLVRRHPSYDGDLSIKDLKKQVSWTLNKNKSIFESQSDRAKYPQWIIKPGIMKLPSRYKQKLQKLILHDMMMTRWRIRGWSLVELVEGVTSMNSDFRIDPGACQIYIKKYLAALLSQSNGLLFEQVAKKMGSRWRAIDPRIIKLRTCSSHQSWHNLVSVVFRDENVPITSAHLIDRIRRYAYLFGWDMAFVPHSHLQKEIIRVMESYNIEVI